MYWVSEVIERFREVSDFHIILSMASRFLLGMGLGVLLATKLPIWTGWMFIIVALVIAIPSIMIVYTK